MIVQNQLPSRLPPIIGVDIECSCVNGELSQFYVDEVVLLQFAVGENQYVLDRDHIKANKEQIINLLTGEEILKVFQNGAFDIGFLRLLLGIDCIGPVWDTLIVERVLTCGKGEPCDLASIARRRLGTVLDKQVRKSFHSSQNEFSERQISYAARDVAVLIPIYEQQVLEIKRESLEEVAELENKLVPVVAEMELNGIGFSRERWDVLANRLEQERATAYQKTLWAMELPSYTVDLFGGISGVNLNSPIQIQDQLSRMGIALSNTRFETLERYLQKHPDCAAIEGLVSYRNADKRLGFNYPQHINPITGRIHTHFNQVGADTSRFSSSNPNLQNVPRDKDFRACFIADDGKVLITADYDQQEMRLMAQLSGDSRLRQVCNDTDIHTVNARIMFRDKSITQSDPRRQLAKNAGFAILYGAGADTLARTIKVRVTEAMEILEILRRTYPQVNSWGKRQLRGLKANGYVTTLLGRKLWFPGAQGSIDIGRYATTARNAPDQGSAADCLKLALVKLYEQLPSDVKLLLCVHDEIIAEAPEERADQYSRDIIRYMEEAGQVLVDCVPMSANAVVAKEWSKS